MGELRAEKRLVRSGDEFDTAEIGTAAFEERVPGPEPAEEPAEPWATGTEKPMTGRLRERLGHYLEHVRRA